VTGADTLTTVEQRVVTLAVSGDTNAEIARALFVSETTVEGHLRRAYRKLGIRSRRDLPPAVPLAAEGLSDEEPTRFQAFEVVGTGPPPEDEDAARAEIAAAFAGHGTLSEDRQSLAMVEDGENLGPTLLAAQERQANFIAETADISVSVDVVQFVDATHAAVWFTIAADGRPLLQHHGGGAVMIDGTWKMARSTFCGLMSLGGVQCPPPSEA